MNKLDYDNLDTMKDSPDCQISCYQHPSFSCEYFGWLCEIGDECASLRVHDAQSDERAEQKTGADARYSLYH